MSNVPTGIAVDSIHEQAQRISASRRFANSKRHGRLLRYLLEQTLAGRGDQLKEYVLGVDVFDRRDTFDPQTDAIVRTELSRFRAKLRDYYEGEGRGDALIIDLPKRSYSLTFQLRESGSPQARAFGGTQLAGPPEASEALAVAPRPARSWLGVVSFWGSSIWLGGTRLAVAVLVVVGLTGVWGLVRPGVHATQEERMGGNRTSVAVLPFANLSTDPEWEYFSDGLTEELIHGLAETDDLRVVSRTAAFQFKGKHEDLRSIAAQLHAGVVLDGTVRRSGDRLRVTTRLVNATEGYQLGSQVYERGLQDVVVLQQQIARQVASTLRAHMIGTKRLTNSVEAYNLYLQGRYHADNRSEWELKKAIHCYERAIAADPGYAPAHASLADAYVLLALLNEAPPAEAMQRAKEAAQHAVKTGEALPHAHSALGSVLSLYDWDWAAAEKEFNRALELDPNDSGIRQAYAVHCLLPQGRLDSALFEMQLAQGLDPFSPEVLVNLGKVHYFKRDPDRAIQTFRTALHLEPGFEAAPLALAKAYVQKSLVDQAMNTLQGASAPTEDEARLAVLGHAYALSRQPDRARQVLAQLREAARQRYVSGYYFALIHLALGEKAQALDWLEKAAAERSPLIVYLKGNPLFDSVRSEPRFAALLKKTGLGA